MRTLTVLLLALLLCTAIHAETVTARIVIGSVWDDRTDTFITQPVLTFQAQDEARWWWYMDPYTGDSALMALYQGEYVEVKNVAPRHLNMVWVETEDDENIWQGYLIYRQATQEDMGRVVKKIKE